MSNKLPGQTLTAAQEWEEQKEILETFRKQRALVDQELAACADAPNEALIEKVASCLRETFSLAPLSQDEEIRAAFWLDVLQEAEQKEDVARYMTALTGVLLYLSATKIPAIRTEWLEPWMAGVFRWAFSGEKHLTFDSTEEDRNKAMLWCMAFAQDIIERNKNKTLRGGEDGWRRWRHALAFAAPFIPFHPTFTNLKPFASLFGTLRKECYLDYKKGFPPPSEQTFQIVGEWKSRAESGKKVRIGLMAQAPYLHGHGLPDFIWWLAALDRAVFEPILIMNKYYDVESPLEDFLKTQTDRLLKYAPFVVTLATSIEKIQSLDLDILYNFNGFSWGRGDLMENFPLAKKHIIGFYTPSTTGCSEVDYYMTTEALDPDYKETFTEKTILTEGLPFCFHYKTYFNGMPTRARKDPSLPPGAVVYSLGSSITKKLTRSFMDVLLEILKQVPNAVVTMMPDMRKGKRAHFLSFLLEKCKKAGVDPERFILYPMSSRSEIFRMLAASDVFLDFFPFTGSNNVIDPIYAGVPPVVLSPPRGHLRNRIGSIILNLLDLGDLTAPTPEAYLDLAVRLGRDKKARAAFKNRLGPSVLYNSSLYNGPAFIERIQPLLLKILGDEAPSVTFAPLPKREELERQIDADFNSFISDPCFDR